MGQSGSANTIIVSGFSQSNQQMLFEFASWKHLAKKNTPLCQCKNTTGSVVVTFWLLVGPLRAEVGDIFPRCGLVQIGINFGASCSVFFFLNTNTKH